MKNLLLTELKVRDIATIKANKHGRVITGGVLGGIAGLAIGITIGKMKGTPNTEGLIAGMIAFHAIPVGMLVGTINPRTHIRGSQSTYEKKKKKLSKYLVTIQ